MVDDNSPDGTGAIADQLAAANPRVHVLHRDGKEGLGKAYIAGFRWALEQGYDLVFEMDADFSHDPRFLPSLIEAISDADLVIGSRYKTGVNVINWPISRLLLSLGANQYARFVTGLPLTDSTGGFKCFRRQVLEAISTGAGPIERLRLSDRDELPGLEEGLPAQGDSDRLHRPGRGSEQDEQEDRPGSGLDGLVAAFAVAHEAGMKGTVFYKMTGSGNDFVLLDGRSTTPESWPPERIAALCDRRDGIGADGLVILTPEDGDAVRMAFFNSDGSRAAMCGNAALCSARLAAHLEFGSADGMRLLTDAGGGRDPLPG